MFLQQPIRNLASRTPALLGTALHSQPPPSSSAAIGDGLQDDAAAAAEVDSHLNLPAKKGLTASRQAAYFGRATQATTAQAKPVTQWKLAARTDRMTSSAIRDLLKLTAQRGVISFAGGLPSPETFPVAEFAAACTRVLGAPDACAALQYTSTEGLPVLRQAVADSLPWDVSPENVLITTGSQQALDLVAKVLVDPGSRILVETPTYLGALQAFQPMEPTVVSVESDDGGMLADDLAAKVKGARLVYVLPNFQNPTGRSMDAARRAEISDVARRAGVPVLEDNPYGELWFDQPPPAPMAAHCPENTLYMGSFSKVLAPGLRLGFLVAPPHIHQRLVMAKQAADLHSSHFDQRVVAEVLRDGFLDRHVPGIRDLYKGKRDAMLAALQRHMHGLGVRWNRPAGGMFLWVRLPAGMSATALLPRAVEKNVAFVPGSPFYAGAPDERNLRLSFVTATVEQIDAGVAALAEALREAQKARTPR